MKFVKIPGTEVNPGGAWVRADLVTFVEMAEPAADKIHSRVWTSGTGKPVLSSATACDVVEALVWLSPDSSEEQVQAFTDGGFDVIPAEWCP